MKIGIVGAMAQEVEILTSLLTELQTHHFASFTLYQGKLDGKDVAIVQSGIGKVAASIGTTVLVQTYQPDMVINTGSAGGIAQGLKIGDVVISTHTAYHDADVTAFGYAKGQLPNCPATFESDAQLVALAKQSASELGHLVHCGMICSGDSFIHGGEKLAQIKSDFPTALAVEMEAAAIAHVCHAFNTPFVVVRAISDAGDGNAEMSFEEFLPIAAKQSSQLIRAMIQAL